MLHICTAQARWWIIIPESRVWILSMSKKLFFLSDIPHSSDTDADPTYSTKAPTVEYPFVAPEGAVENVSMVHVFVIIVVFFIVLWSKQLHTVSPQHWTSPVRSSRPALTGRSASDCVAVSPRTACHGVETAYQAPTQKWFPHRADLFVLSRSTVSENETVVEISHSPPWQAR